MAGFDGEDAQGGVKEGGVVDEVLRGSDVSSDSDAEVCEVSRSE